MAPSVRRKFPTPSYFGRIFTLAARGASIDLHVEYVNDLDTPIDKRTCIRGSNIRRLHKAYVRRKVIPHIRRRIPCKGMDVGTAVVILRCLRKSNVNGAGRRLRSRRRH